jgi:hypothetical protein
MTRNIFIFFQAIKQKLKIRSKLALVDEQPSPQEEDKAKMLFGNRHAVCSNNFKAPSAG